MASSSSSLETDQTTTMIATSTGQPTVALHAKRVIYVGGLPESITELTIRATFIPFGPIANVHLPMDYVQGTHRGFCFVEMEDAEDAEEAIYNVDGSEMNGRTIRVSLAQANQLNKLEQSSSGVGGGYGGNSSFYKEAIWKSDEWFQQQANNHDNNNAVEYNTEQEKIQLAALQE